MKRLKKGQKGVIKRITERLGKEEGKIARMVFCCPVVRESAELFVRELNGGLLGGYSEGLIAYTFALNMGMRLDYQRKHDEHIAEGYTEEQWRTYQDLRGRAGWWEGLLADRRGNQAA